MSNLAEYPQDKLAALVEKALAGMPTEELLTVFFEEATRDLEELTLRMQQASAKMRAALQEKAA